MFHSYHVALYQVMDEVIPDVHVAHPFPLTILSFGFEQNSALIVLHDDILYWGGALRLQEFGSPQHFTDTVVYADQFGLSA